MKKIIIDFSKIKHHDEIDISLLKEGFIFNECGLIINDCPGTKHPFKIGMQFVPEKQAVYFSVYGRKLETIFYYFGYDVMRGFHYGRIDKDISEDQEEIEASGMLIDMCLDACMTIKDAAYERAIEYKKHPEDLKLDTHDMKKFNKLKKKHKMEDIYLMDDLVIYMATTLPEEKLKRHMNCPVWDVRGFYRHYKSGKVVWINSFQKGRDRNKGLSTDKTYIADKQDKK